MSEVTRILSAIGRGDAQAAEELLPLVYNELRRLAAHHMAQEKPGQTLDATALVHEAYLRLVGGGSFADRQHFFRVAAEAMRQVLIDRARRRRRVRHGGGRERVPLDDPALTADIPPDELLALDDALTKFAAVDPVKAELVKLRFFAGMSEEDAAAALGISRPTASRYWAFARAWLIDTLDGNRE
jgi:RNA polymerase sigma factor (TIGR02999 family)